MDILEKWQQFKSWHQRRVNEAKTIYDLDYLELVELIMSYSVQRRKDDYKRIEGLYKENQKLLIENHKLQECLFFAEHKYKVTAKELDKQLVNNTLNEEQELLQNILKQIEEKLTVLRNYEGINSEGKEGTTFAEPDNSTTNTTTGIHP